MKYLSIFYDLVFGLLQTLGMSPSVTHALTLLSLAAVAAGIVIVAPEAAVVIALVLAILGLVTR